MNQFYTSDYFVGQPFRAAAGLPPGAPAESRRQAERPAPLEAAQ